MSGAPTARNALAHTIRREGDWLIDDAGNKNSVIYWGSEERAREALESLKDCRDCINCSDCSRCSRCSDCSGCSRCSRCSDCSGCLDCSRCSGCSGCSGCSRCSRCLDCSDCRNVAYLRDKQNLNANPDLPEGLKNGPPPVPVIENIHQRIYEAASRPEALNMSTWHTCENTHCRAGWAVTLAGEAGRALEDFYDTPLAAMLIYDASDPSFQINPGRFFEKNAEALADMKALAERNSSEVRQP